jgi:hypothetical protein
MRKLERKGNESLHNFESNEGQKSYGSLIITRTNYGQCQKEVMLEQCG